MDRIAALRPLLLLVFYGLAFWLVARVLRQSLLGRVGQVGKLLLFAAAVGGYALTVVLTATGGAGSLPWAPVLSVLGPLPSRTLLFAVLVLAAVWLILRELPFPVPAPLGFVLENPVRRLLAPADVVLSRMALAPGMKVVEVGCGTGYLSCEVARRIAPRGTLYCIDIQPGMVERARRRVERAGLGNVEFFVARADKLPFDIFDADLVFMVQVLGEIADRPAALREAARVLQPQGVLSISESIIDPHYRFRSDVVRRARQAGFELDSVQGSIFGYTATFRQPQAREPLGYVPRQR